MLIVAWGYFGWPVWEMGDLTPVLHAQDPYSRYSGPFMRDKVIIPQQQGPRKQILQIERNYVETNPGPLNKEPWRGKRLE